MSRTIKIAVFAAALWGCNEAGIQVTAPDGSVADAAATDLGQGGTADQGQAVDSGNEQDLGAPVDMNMRTEADAGADVGVDMGPSNRSAGCGSGAGLPEGENTFSLEGLDRRYILRLPENYSNDRAWPLVLALHGNGGTPDYWDATSGTRNIRDVLKDDAVLVIAHAIDNQWRDYSMPADTYPARINQELAYFDKIITDAENNLCIDTSAKFSMGFSGGGSFSGVLGCRRTDIRAIAVGGSVIYFDEANCVGTPASWITIGTQELEPPREAYRDYFRDLAGCDATSTATAPAPCVAYDNCGAGTPVHYCQHPDGHIWPDFGSQAMWDFFSQFVTQP